MFLSGFQDQKPAPTMPSPISEKSICGIPVYEIILLNNLFEVSCFFFSVIWESLIKY